MDKKDFLEKLQDVLQTETELTFDTVLDDLEEWDSLSKMAATAFLDKNFGIRMTLTEIKAFKTVGDIAQKAGV